jgi:hypothetical protein
VKISIVQQGVIGQHSMRTKGSFTIDILLRHYSYSPEHISRTLSIKPQGSRAAGDKLAGLRAKWTSVYARLQEGNGPSDYEKALRGVVTFLQRNDAFWTDFTGEKGEVELILNHTICPDGEKRLESYISPDFLRHLSTRRIGLRVQGWAG